MNLIVKSIFGSHLYGTNNKNSDTDYKGIYLPTMDDCYLNNISKSINNSTGNDDSKNGKDDVDEEIYSLQYFMRLALKGEMIVIDMIHTPDEFVVKKHSYLWDALRYNRKMFYSKTLHGYLGYIKTQTSKYGVKGERLDSMIKFKEFLSSKPSHEKLSVMWDELPQNEFAMYVENIYNPTIGMYECCGKKFHDTVTVEYTLDIITRLSDNYGARAKMARDNEGIDWKAVSHAFRACYQLIEIYKTGDLIYPLERAEYIRDIKEGKLHFKDDNLSKKLDNLLVSANILAEGSDYPKKVNVHELNKFILKCYE